MNGEKYDLSLELAVINEDSSKFFVKTQFNSTNRLQEKLNISRIAEATPKTYFQNLRGIFSDNRPHIDKISI